jgi:hypothetical protein
MERLVYYKTVEDEVRECRDEVSETLGRETRKQSETARNKSSLVLWDRRQGQLVMLAPEQCDRAEVLGEGIAGEGSQLIPPNKDRRN